MRQLNRLNQFQRLWQQSQGAPQQTCVAEMARHCICSERHLRTLLSQWQHAGWLSWRGEPGRGKQGQIVFLRSPEQLRQQLLQQQLDAGDAAEALQLLDLPPERLINMLRPLMGGQWQNDTPVLRIPYYRPMESTEPRQITGRAEQHLARQIYSGLTRFEQDEPVGDLAHHWQYDEASSGWLFWLRPQLMWHNDEPVQAAQLVAQFQQLLRDRRVSMLLADVVSVDAPHPLAVRFVLRRPDFWLPHRLAHLLCLLPHPIDPVTGSGPWKLRHFSTELVRIESHARWHLQRPLLQAVEYWITPQLFDPALGSSCRHPVQIAIGDATELRTLQPVSSSISLGFCYLVCRPRAGFTADQARTLFQLIQQSGIVSRLPLDEGLITPSKELLPGWSVPLIDAVTVPLPATLTLHYQLPVELHQMSQALVALLKQHGCTLKVVFHPVKNWHGIDPLDEADIVMGDRLIGDAPVFTLASWLQTDPLWRPLWPTQQGEEIQAQLLAIQQIADDETRARSLHQLYHQLMTGGILLPLFNYRYQIYAPPGVEGIELNTLGWFDFSRAWIPPPIDPPCSCSAAD
ncbi:SgrR family transcriptional regulator [Pantoea agglomerans]|uniref:SgrR family transcriptional regulator n=1 Tax=Enterobacter agglomerans TaxID=549 RepID=UPI00202DB440|nr:SgrR family transcriptional regulator [Pantoea agglomerans]MCL6409490.1 SgrR family transcriptional regulator [Pantoea agglomerans]